MGNFHTPSFSNRVSEEYCTPVDYKGKKIIDNYTKCAFFNQCTEEKCDGRNVLLYGCGEAYRWNGIYTYYCPIGLILIASAVADEKGELEGGIVSGPICMGDMDEIHGSKIREKISGVRPEHPRRFRVCRNFRKMQKFSCMVQQIQG